MENNASTTIPNTKVPKKKETRKKSYPTITIESLINYMIRYTSEQYRLSFNEIVRAMSEVSRYCVTEYIKNNKTEGYLEFYELDENDYEQIHKASLGKQKYNSKAMIRSVKTQVERLLDTYTNHVIIAETYICVSNFPSSDDDKVYYVKSPFNAVQLRLLRDAISIYPYAEPAETNKIINSLNVFTDVYNREKYDPEKVIAVKYPGSYYQNLIQISKAFSTFKDTPKVTPTITKDDEEITIERYENLNSKGISKLKFKYCEYDENKELKVRPVKVPCTDDPDVRIVNPVKLMWVNGFYYLVTYVKNPDKSPIYINYRVDRMKEVECLTDEPADLPANFNPDKHKFKNPVMYSRKDKCEEIVILCKKSLINNAIDTFGFDIKIETTPQPDEVRITLNDITPNGVVMWALEYGFGAEVISPPEVRQSITDAVKVLAQKYP